MVKIVELDETETTGLASAGIGLAGSELPNKRKVRRRPAASAGAAGGGAASEETRERSPTRADAGGAPGGSSSRPRAGASRDGPSAARAGAFAARGRGGSGGLVRLIIACVVLGAYLAPTIVSLVKLLRRRLAET